MSAPGPNEPIVDFPSPIVLDTIGIELSSNKLGTSEPLEPGAPYRKQGHTAKQLEDFAGMVFLGQKATADDEWLRLTYGTEPATQDVHNWKEDFSGDANAYPIFARSYLERRDSYTPRTKATAFTGVYRIAKTAGGTGYTSAPTVVITGDGSGATAIAILDNDGGVSKITVKSEGSGYTTAPTITFTGGGGSGATATAYIQPAECVLVAEKTDDAQEPYDSLYLKVLRLYETLPGPWIPFTRYDMLLGPIQGRRRAVLNTGQSASLSASTKTTYEGREGSSIVSWQIEESWDSANFSGAGQTDDLWDNERGDVHRVTVLSTTNDGASLSVSGGIATEVHFEAYNSYLWKKITDTWAIPAEPLPSEDINEDGTTTVRTQTMELRTDIVEGETVSGGNLIKISSKAFSRTISWKITEVRPLPGTETTLLKEFDEFGGLETTTQTPTVVTTVPTNSVVSTVPHVQRLKVLSSKEARLFDTIRVTGSIVKDIDKVDANIPGSRATREYYLVLTSSTIPDDTAVITYERKRFPGDKNLQIEIKTTYVIPSSFVEFRDQGYPFPTLFNSFYKDDIQGATRDARSGFSANVPHKVTHSFSITDPPVPPVPYQIIENNLLVFSMALSGLMNAITAHTTVGGVTYNQSISASSPSKSTYTGLIGSNIIVGGGCAVYRAKIYHTETIEVTLQ